MAATKQPLPLGWTILLKWIAVPLVLSAVGFYIVGPKLAAAPKSIQGPLERIRETVQPPKAGPSTIDPSEHSPALAAATPGPSEHLRSSIAPPPARPVATAPRTPMADPAQTPLAPADSKLAPPTDVMSPSDQPTISERSTTGVRSGSSADPQVSVTVRPVSKATHSTTRTRRRRRRKHPKTTAKPTDSVKVASPTDDGSFGGTEEGAAKPPSN
jgi:hypothetical protein